MILRFFNLGELALRSARAGTPCIFLEARSCAAVMLSVSILLGAIPSAAQIGSGEENYKDLRKRGEYLKALSDLERKTAELEYAPPWGVTHDRARLLFAVGRVDEAIEDMEFVAKRRRQPVYSLELALMYKYRGKPLLYDQWIQQAAIQMQGSRWRYQRRGENIAAVGRILELLGTNPKTILTAHYGQAFDLIRDLGAVAYVGAGDLAYRNQGYDIAEKHYLKALEKQPKNQDALAGLIECYQKSHDERIEGVMNTLRGINPNHPRADAVRTEQLLEVGRTEEASEIIEKQLAINPISHRFRALKVAMLFLDDELEAMQSVINEALDYNPIHSEIYRTPGRLASRHYRFQEGLEFQEKALESDADDYEARALYTLDLMRLGRELEGREELQRAFEADPFNVQLYNLLQLMDTLATFETLERGAFVLRLPKDEEPILGEAALDLLDEAIMQMEAKYDVELEKPILVEMFDNHDDFMVRSVGLPGNAGHLGICFGKLVTMDAPSVRPRGSSNWRSVLWHEFVHVITLQKTKNRMPRWLSEGISVFEEGERSTAWWNRLDPNYMQIIAHEGIPELSEIDAFFTKPKSSMHLMFGYFIAGDFVRFYVNEYGHGALVAALSQIAEGTHAEEALLHAAESTSDDLNNAFNAHLEERFRPFDNLPQAQKDKPGIPEILAGRLPDGGLFGGANQRTRRPRSPFTDAMTEAEDAIEAEDWEKAEEALLRAYALFPDYGGSDAPLRSLAQVYMRLDRPDSYRETLELLVKASPQELDATIELLDLYQREGDWPKVAAQADWALGIDPYSPELYRALVDALAKTQRGYEALDALEVLTHLDSGKASNYRLQRAQILTEMKDWEPAKREVLLLLEELPHYWKAQELLLRIVEDGAAEELEVFEDLEIIAHKEIEGPVQ